MGFGDLAECGQLLVKPLTNHNGTYLSGSQYFTSPVSALTRT